MNDITARLRRMNFAFSLSVAAVASTISCTTLVDPNAPSSRPFDLGELAKTDTDATLELFVAEQRRLIGLLLRKLYLRNPRELAKVPHMSIERRMRDVLDENYVPREFENLSGVDQLRRALDPAYAEDRVLAFVCGLRTMVDDSFDGKQELYLIDYLDPQRLYHCARNLELAAWKITHDVGADGDVLLLTNSMSDDAPMNLSYERLFGQMIALQDMSARIVADRSNRAIRFVGQVLVFLPV
jgi:hypothetical protein